MKRIIECPVCGEKTTHYEVPGLAEYANNIIFPNHGNHEEKKEPIALIKYQSSIWGDASGGTVVNAFFNALICEKCGHVHLFSNELVHAIKNEIQHLKDRKKALEGKIKDLEADINPLVKEQDHREREIERLNKLLASEDITIKQQKQYTKDLETISAFPYSIKNKIQNLINELSPLKEELKKTKTELKKYE